MSGSDPQELMAEIEEFLRTGDAPAPAPEPSAEVRRGLVPTRPPIRPRTGPFSDFPGRPHEVLLDRWRAGAELRRRRPPRWTPARVAWVLGVISVLVVLPVVFSDRSSRPSNTTSDRASAAPQGPGYTFLRRNPSGTPVRWNPCEPIYYQTDLTGAPSYVATDLQLAAEKVSQATGMLFASVPLFASSSVHVEWSTAPGAPLAQAVPEAAVDQLSGASVYVSGTVTISSAAATLPAGFGPGGIGVALLRALGGLVGLGPTSSPGQIMNPEALSNGTDTFGRGDLAGLKRLGLSSGCLTVPTGASLQPSL